MSICFFQGLPACGSVVLNLIFASAYMGNMICRIHSFVQNYWAPIACPVVSQWLQCCGLTSPLEGTILLSGESPFYSPFLPTHLPTWPEPAHLLLFQVLIILFISNRKYMHMIPWMQKVINKKFSSQTLSCLTIVKFLMYYIRDSPHKQANMDTLLPQMATDHPYCSASCFFCRIMHTEVLSIST